MCILTSAVDLSVCLSVDLQAALVLPRVGGWNAEIGGAKAAGRYELVAIQLLDLQMSY